MMVIAGLAFTIALRTTGGGTRLVVVQLGAISIHVMAGCAFIIGPEAGCC